MRQLQAAREPQHFMTTDPDKVWPNGIVPYFIDDNIGESSGVIVLFPH